jgi:hypothetical protein
VGVKGRRSAAACVLGVHESVREATGVGGRGKDQSIQPPDGAALIGEHLLLKQVICLSLALESMV